MDAQPAGERDELLARIGALTASFESTSLSTMLEPLLSTELSIRQLKVLTVIASAGDGATGKGLAETFGVSIPSMSALLDRLVAQDVAVRTPDERDSRVRRVRVTPLGRAVVRRLVAARPEFNAEILSRLAVDDLHALLRGLSAVHREMERLADGGGRREL